MISYDIETIARPDALAYLDERQFKGHVTELGMASRCE